jgi:hypothetical protein
MSTQLADVIAIVESSDTSYELRFEEDLYQTTPSWITDQEAAVTKGNGYCNAVTARMIACSSWGRYQMLGADIYSLDFTSPIANFLGSTALQDMVFRQFLAQKDFQPTEDISTWAPARFTAFAAFYNGPGETADYVAAMKKAAGMA